MSWLDYAAALPARQDRRLQTVWNVALVLRGPEVVRMMKMRALGSLPVFHFTANVAGTGPREYNARPCWEVPVAFRILDVNAIATIDPDAEQIVSVSSDEVLANNSSLQPSISQDGNLVVFASNANNLVAGDTNSTTDVFLRDIAAGTTVRLSVDALGVQGNNFSQESVISPDGTFVVFRSGASNLVAGDSNGVDELFLRDLASGTVTQLSPNGNVFLPVSAATATMSSLHRLPTTS